jgi:predicted small lipoprotein YifL
VLHLKPQTILRPAPGQQSCAGLARTGESLYGAAALGILIVNRNYSPRPSGWAIILLIAAALAGCGRKGGLDLPPTASSAAVAEPADSDAEGAGRPSVFNPYYGTETSPAATKGRKKAFVLDPLLND